MMSFCKLFVNSKEDLETLVSEICSELDIIEKSKPASTFYIDTSELNISAFRNKEFNIQKLQDPLDGFLFYPIIIEVELTNNKELDEINMDEKNKYLQSVLHLVGLLRKISSSVVPACDFEDYLNNPESVISSQPCPST